MTHFLIHISLGLARKAMAGVGFYFWHATCLFVLECHVVIFLNQRSRSYMIKLRFKSNGP